MSRLTTAQQAEIAVCRANRESIASIAVKIGVSTRTVSRHLKSQRGQLSITLSKIASRNDVLEVATQILRNTEARPLERLSAGKMLSLMQGWITTEQATAAQVNINLVSSKDLPALEAEYKQLTGRPLGTTIAQHASDETAETEHETLNHAATIPRSEGGGTPPASCDEDDSASPQILPENLATGV